MNTLVAPSRFLNPGDVLVAEGKERTISQWCISGLVMLIYFTDGSDISISSSAECFKPNAWRLIIEDAV